MLPAPPLLLITDRRQGRGDLADVVAAACASGCRWVSLREKDLAEAEQLALFARIRRAAAPFGARLTLHGTPELACAASADGVHLPDGADPARARALLGAGALVGLSVHRPAGAEVDRGDVDYITASPVFLTASKPGHGPALGLGGLSAFVAAASVPVVALGGITTTTAAACRMAGAGAIAVMGDVMRAQDPRRTVAALIAAVGRGPSSS
ncbi:thiamine phosphate synthase [Xanthobacter sp. V4C-4]|uniref:thiamine phosphate synthase n=1 Tax=Xanthobacter cornucopiae TaxID=3119924 RepID=UPI00372AB5F8